MTEIKKPKVLLTQIEDALEERQRNDPRQQQVASQDLVKDRRQGDRRDSKE